MANNPVLTLCGTYTLEPVADVVEFWFDFLSIDASGRVAPYAQLFQQLLDPTSDLRRNQSGANALLLRWTDLLPHSADSCPGQWEWSDLAACVSEVAAALKSFEHRVPCLLLAGPANQGDPLLERATSELQAMLARTTNVFVEHGEQAMQRYRVERVHDPAADRFGHVPFTTEAIAAVGTTVARWYAALGRAPLKLIAVDADHTLWSGVVAEDGVDGIEVTGAHICLQQALVAQHDAGRLLCLLSKNEQSDVRRVFERHPGMPLTWPHLVAHRVDWNPKPDNLAELVAGLELGLDSVAFLDDNPVECAQMRARCPAVATVRVPTDRQKLASFADHLWLFDRSTVTAEDRSRARMYQQNASRAELRRGTDSLQSFLDSLGLDVEIAPPAAEEIPRLAQLTQRTNQFNASLIRCDERDVASDGEATGAFHRFVRARDRFGDYGIVGQVRARADGKRLAVDLFQLSCRALGRGIEHRMVAAAGAHALATGLEEVAVLFRHGERNQPARRFLEQVFGAPAHANDGQGPQQWFHLRAHEAANVAFDASGSDTVADADTDAAAAAAVGRRPHPAPADPARTDIAARYEYIAHSLTTAALIERAIAARVRPRADLATAFIAPAPGLERDIAAIWRDVLRIDPIGSRDRFQDLGGKSMHLVQVHGLLLDRLQVDLDITTLFQHPTVASLAAHLAARSDGGAMDAARQRGMQMRAARTRAAQRSATRHSGVAP